MKDETIQRINTVIFSTKAIADLFGVTDRTVRNWADDGMPKIAGNQFSLVDCFNWWNDNINKPVSDKDISGRERLSLAKAELAEIELAEKKGRLFPQEQFHEEWARRAADLRQSLESAEFALAPLVIDLKNEIEAGEILSVFFSRVLESYCRDGRFTPQSKAVKASQTKPDKTKKAGKKR